MTSEDSENDRGGPRPEPGGDRPDWDVEVDVDAGADANGDGDVDTDTDADPAGSLSVGDSVRFGKPISAADVERFAVASGDTNPLHLDDEWAESTRFEGPIVHGTLVAGLVSAALARLPGGVVYLSQDLEFRAPVRIGDRVSAEVTVREVLPEDRYRLETTASTDGELVLDGEAVILLEDVPDS